MSKGKCDEIWERAAQITETMEPFDPGANVSPMDRLERMMCERMRERIADALRKQIGIKRRKDQ